MARIPGMAVNHLTFGTRNGRTVSILAIAEAVLPSEVPIKQVISTQSTANALPHQEKCYISQRLNHPRGNVVKHHA